MNQRRTIAVWVFLLASMSAVVALAQQSSWTKPPVMGHDAEGRAACLMCHTPGKMEPVPDAPASHAEWTDGMCLWCHAADAAVQTTDPPAIAHPLEGRAACLMCHAAGKMEPVPDTPADHEGREDKICTICHKPAA